MIDPLLAQASTIITYGGGEILQKMFQAISMLFNGGNGGLIRPIMVIASSIGGVYAFSRAFFTSVGESLILGYFFPLIVITSILMIPSTTVHIEDVLNSSRAEGEAQTSSYAVNNVPWLLAKFAEVASTIGYRLSEGIETVMHMPNDANYNATGMIFGSDASLDISKYRLSNANLEQSLRQFSKQCVLYDIALNRYSLDDIKKATDLWNFFEQKTSNVRMIRYCPPDAKQIGFDQCSYVTCKEAIEKMKPFFEKEKERYAKLEIGRNLPLTLQALTGIQRESKELIGQQLTMNVLSDELSGGQFAKYRAYTQQQSTYRTMGSLASNGLVTMRIVFEALIYAVFIFIVPLSLTPGGTKYLINWAWLVIWIQMWPPLYAILNYIMQIAARYKFDGWFAGLTTAQKGLSFFTSLGMQNLSDEIFALAAFLSVSVPYISYILLKEGLSSFVQLAGSLMAPAQNAASSSAAEQVSGNYSFANTSFGQASYNNTTGLQTNMSPSISSGYFSDNQGEISTMYGGSTPIVRQSTSELRTSVFADDVIGKNLQKQKQEAQSIAQNAQETYANNLSYSTRVTSDYMAHLGDSTNYSQNYSEREGYGIQDSVSHMQSIAENWGKQYGLNTRDSMDLLLGASLSGGMDWGIASAKINAGGNLGRGAVRDEMVNSALSVSKSEGFQQNLQKVQDYAKSQAFNSGHDEGSRLSEGVCDSLDHLSSSQDSYQVATSQLQQVSENTSWFETNSQLIKRSLNQDFMKWASQEYQETGGFDRVREILSEDRQADVQPLIQGFVRHIREEGGLPQSIQGFAYQIQGFAEDFQSRKQHSTNEMLNHGEEVSTKLQEKISNAFHNDLYGEDIFQRFSQTKNSHETRTETLKDKLDEQRDQASDNFDLANSKFLIGRLYQGPESGENLGNNSKITEAPFWLSREEE